MIALVDNRDSFTFNIAQELMALGAEVRVAGPPTMLPADIESLGVKAYTNLREAIEGADVVMALRIQMERLEGACFPSVRSRRSWSASIVQRDSGHRFIQLHVVVMGSCRTAVLLVLARCHKLGGDQLQELGKARELEHRALRAESRVRAHRQLWRRQHRHGGSM